MNYLQYRLKFIVPTFARGDNTFVLNSNMDKKIIIATASFCVVFGYILLNVRKTLYTVPPRPKSADENPWWGPGEYKNEPVVIKKFTVNVSNSVSFNILSICFQMIIKRKY